MKISESTAIVTGANGGLGVGFVAGLLARGATQVFAAARNPQEWADPRIQPIALDVTDPESVTRAAAQVGEVDIVINNAGVFRTGGLIDGPLDDLRTQIATNVVGPVLVARAFAPVLRSRAGALVNVGSVLSWVGTAGGYSVSKAALWSATNALRLELDPDGVLVLGAYLAYADTPMASGVVGVAKTPPADIVAQVLDGIEANLLEVLADDTTRRVRAALAAPVETLYPSLQTGVASGRM
jgi:NAD(P)-dependent dehydrogenase (short-subunit alcohol dehydrogenase family)